MDRLLDRKTRQNTKAHVFMALLAVVGITLLTVCRAPALNSTNDPNLLQSRAIQTVESFKSNVRRTGDMTSMLPAMRTANEDLKASYQAFIARGDLAAAALSQLTMADIERMTNLFSSAGQDSAAERYRNALELSRGAKRVDYEFKALVGLGLTESNQSLAGSRQADLASASQHVTQALDLALASGDKSFVLRALDDLSQIEVKRQNFDAARNYLERAQVVAAELPESAEQFEYQMDTGDLYYSLASRCDLLSKPHECSQWFDLARSAYEAGLAVARNLQYDYFAGVAKSFLQQLDLQRVLGAQQLAYDARIVQSQSNTEIAESALRQALTIQEKSLKPDDAALVNTLVALADLLVTSNRTEEAVLYFRRALAITQKDSGRQSPRVAQILSSLSLVYLKQAKYEEALSLLHEAADIQEQLRGTDQSSLATTLSSLGSVYLAEGKYKEAEPYYQRSLAIRRMTFGTQSAITANSLTDLAGLYYHLGEYDEAKRYYETALSALENTLGRDHTEVATVLNNLALVYQAQAEYDRAEVCLQRALTIRRKALGENHPETAATLNNLAMLDFTLGKYDEASRLFEEAFDIDSKALGANHPTTMTIADNLAEVRNMKKENPGPKQQN
jgi:tetratricopeptide (TPR) repeat protein